MEFDEDPPKIPEPIVVDGVVRAKARGALALVYGVLTVDGVTRSGATTDVLDVQRDDGRHVEVEIDADRTRVLPLETHRGRWEDLARNAFADPFQDEAPEPRARVTLSSAELVDGVRVCIHGEVLERTTLAGRDLPARVRADVLAFGPEPAERIAREVQGRKPPGEVAAATGVRSLAAAELAAFGLAGAYLGGAALLSPLVARFECVVIAVGLALSAAALRTARADRWPFFYAGRAAIRPDAQSPRFPYAVTLVMALATGALPLFVPLDTAREPLASLVVLGWAAVLVGLAFHMRAVTATAARIARELVFAPPHEWPPRDGQWGATEGMVAGRARLPVLGVQAPLSALVEEHLDATATPNASATETRTRVVLAPFVIRAGSRRTEIDPAGATWATATRIWSGERATKDFPSVPLYADVVAEGTTVRVVGRMAVGGRLALTRPESLYLFSARAERPMEPLERLLRARRTTFVALLAVAALLVALAAWRPFW